MDRMKQYAQVKRRNFLKYIGQAGVSLPVLQASSLGAGVMLSRQALAATGDVPRKVIFIYVPGGTPSGGRVSYYPDESTFELKVCSKPLEKVKDECVFFKDVAIVGGGGHGVTQRVLGAFGSNNKGSIDLALEDTIGATSPIASVRLGVMSANADPISARNWAASTDFLDNPRSAFDRLFAGTVETGDLGQKQSRLRLNAHKQALTQLTEKLGNYEKQRLEEHETAIAKLQNDINRTADTSGSGSSGACSAVDFNLNGYSTEQTKENFTNQFNLQVENAIMALKCGITQIVTIQVGNQQSEFGVPGLDNIYHEAIHSGNFDFYAAYRAYFSERVAHLIQQLKNTDDGNGGSLLDSTLVVQVADMADANSHTAGGKDDPVSKVGGHAPFMLAGGGRAINRRSVVSVPNHHQILDAVTDYMGMQKTIGLFDGNSTGTVSGILT